MTEPLVSVVIATYNRSNVLSYAIESLLCQTYRNWELIVVGDACTDNTEALMEEFCRRDSRVRFHNRAVNWGDQSGPNNDGVALANGELIAFLNHDDIFLEDHLELLVNKITSSDADMVFSVICHMTSDESVQLRGVARSGEYDPTMLIPASCWLISKATIELVGPWKPARDIYNMSSQEWCFRAWKMSMRMLAVPVITVVAPASGLRKGSYLGEHDAINQQLYLRSRDANAFRQEQLTYATVLFSGQWSKQQGVLFLLKSAALVAAKKLAILLGIHPLALRNFVRHPGRGGLIAHLRRVRGLD